MPLTPEQIASLNRISTALRSGKAPVSPIKPAPIVPITEHTRAQHLKPFVFVSTYERCSGKPVFSLTPAEYSIRKLVKVHLAPWT